MTAALSVAPATAKTLTLAEQTADTERPEPRPQGRYPVEVEIKCDRCDGTGLVYSRRTSDDVPCPECDCGVTYALQFEVVS